MGDCLFEWLRVCRSVCVHVDVFECVSAFVNTCVIVNLGLSACACAFDCVRACSFGFLVCWLVWFGLVSCASR